MTKKVRVIICILVVMSLALPQANASENNLSLKEAITIAYENNPRIVQQRHAIEVSRGELLTSRTWKSPEVELEIAGLKNSDPKVETLGFKQSFDPIGVRGLKRDIKKNEVDVSRNVLREIWAEVYIEVRSLYGQLMLNKKEIELQQSNLTSMQQFYSDVQVRYESGQALKNHMQRAKIDLLKAESDYLESENALSTRKAKLNLLLGRDWNISFEIEDELTEENLILNLDELTAAAINNRPDFQKENISLSVKNSALKKEKWSRLPEYSIGFEMTDREETDYSAVFEISLPLWNLNNGEVKKAKAERNAQTLQVDALENQIGFEVYAAYKECQLTLKQLDLYKQSLTEANEMFRLARLRYKEGHIDFLNYLDQLLTSKDSRMQYFKGLYKLKESINRLEAATYRSLREEDFLK